MNLTKRLYLLFLAIVVVLSALLLAARALAPKAGLELPSTVEDLSSNLLSGTVVGLDPRDSVRLRLEQLAEGGVNGREKTVQRFDVVNGRWEQPDLALPSGHYRLVPEARGYAHIPHSIVFQMPEGSVVGRYTSLDFEFLHPEDAPARLGLPLCPEPSSPVVPVTAVPEGTPSPAPRPESTPSGPCYANHLAEVRLVPAGLHGRISGLPNGQLAILALYALPPVPGEHYGQGEPPPQDSNWTYPPEVSPLAAFPDIASGWTPTASLLVGNGPWGLIDPSLVGSKYLVAADALGLTVQPPAYEVVIFSGKALGLPGDVDFVFGP